jgi:Golgi phosphoprotein 3
MLTFAEEILLIALDDQAGVIKELPTLSLPYALSGAVLMDLALRNKIDTDLKTLTVVDPTPAGDPILDPTLAKIAASTEVKKIEFWLETIANDANQIKASTMEGLIQKKILKKEEHRMLWVFASRRYPVIDNREEKEVKARLRDVLLTDTLPEPRDIVLISLLHACHLLREVLSEQELVQAHDRIQQLAKMDLIGQAVSRSIGEIQNSIMTSMLYPV